MLNARSAYARGSTGEERQQKRTRGCVITATKHDQAFFERQYAYRSFFPCLLAIVLGTTGAVVLFGLM